jgi:hypothetical protein
VKALDFRHHCDCLDGCGNSQTVGKVLYSQRPLRAAGSGGRGSLGHASLKTCLGFQFFIALEVLLSRA